MDADPESRPGPYQTTSDPFLEALAAAEVDDEPFTDEERAAVQEGWQDYLAGRSIPFDELKTRLYADDEAP